MDASLLDPVMAHIVIQYERYDTERYDMLITPSVGGHVFVRLRSPVVGVSSCRLDPWPGQRQEDLCARSIRSVIACFFGEVDAKPRIVGTPDWKEVSLEVSVVRGNRPSRLLLFSLVAHAPARASYSHSNASGVLRDDAISLRPEDADAVYAVTRVALASSPLALPEVLECETERAPSFRLVRPVAARPVAEIAAAA